MKVSKADETIERLKKLREEIKTGTIKDYCCIAFATLRRIVWLDNAISLLESLTPLEPKHIYEKYAEHDWYRTDDGKIDNSVFDIDDHSGPVCKRCGYSFCIFCKPNGWNDEPCVIDEYKCPSCNHTILEPTKFCKECGQAINWNAQNEQNTYDSESF